MARTGRPSRIHEHYDTLPARGGRPARDRTVADALVDLMRLGNYLETAAWVIGVNPSTVRLWIRDGRRAHARLEAGALRRDLSARQRHCSDFFVAVSAAMAEAEQRDVATLAALARGGLPVVKVTERWTVNDEGQEVLVDRTSVRTESLPDARVLTWRLERRFPDSWGRRGEAVDDDSEADDEFGEDPVEEALQDLVNVRRRQLESVAALEAAEMGDIVDAEIVDERQPDGS